MLVPFRKETLSQPRFIRDEVRFDLLFTISGGECAVAFQEESGGAVALENPGFNLWLWIDGDLGSAYAASVIGELAVRLKDAKLPGIVAAPEFASSFSESYCRKSGKQGKQNVSLMAYACPAVKMPAGVPGQIEKAGEERTEIAAGFMRGFQMDCFHTEETREHARATAESKIKAGNLFLWNVEGKTVCMAAIAQRSPRGARIGYVYTPTAERKKGYASALVAQLSLLVQGEALTPVLYADIENPDSNKVYKSIGYLEAGAVEEIGFS